MARQASSKPADSTANLGFEAQMTPFVLRHSGFDISSWVQHFIHCIRRSLGEGGHLAPQGMAGFVLANGSMSSNQSGEGDIRQKLIEVDLVDCMVALPGQLFYKFENKHVALAA